ncbi:MAG: thioredoxin fold domain-containing protein [Candidatus Aenigmatarchaeota archaeon]
MRILSLFLAICGFFFFGKNVYGVDCTLAEAVSIIKQVFEEELTSRLQDTFQPKNLNVKVYTVTPISVGNNLVCEVVYSISFSKAVADDFALKYVSYYGDNFFVSGNFWVFDGKKYVNLTAKKTKELSERMISRVKNEVEERKIFEARKKLLKKEILSEFENIKSLARIKISLGDRVKKEPDAEVVIFSDPNCSPCVHVKDFIFALAKKQKGKLVDVYFIPVGFSETSEKISVGVLCDKTSLNPEEKIDRFFKRQAPNISCEEGKSLVSKGKELIFRYGIKGLPFVILNNNRAKMIKVVERLDVTSIKNFFAEL